MKKLWTFIWVEHGTKFIGGIGLVLAALAAQDRTLLLKIFGDYWAAWIMAIGGAAGIYRGFVNTAALQAASIAQAEAAARAAAKQ